MTLRGYDAWKTTEPSSGGPKPDNRDDFEKGYDQAVDEIIKHLVGDDHRAAAYSVAQAFARSRKP